MSANAWGGVLLRTQSKRCVEVVSSELEAAELFTQLRRLRFWAIPKTRLTWVAFEPLELEDADSLVEGPGVKVVGRLAAALAWLVVNNDYSGLELLSFDATVPSEA